MSPIVFLDTETTSLGTDREPWEIAMIRRDKGRRHFISFFVYPDLSKADPMSLKMSRFYERHPQWDGPDTPFHPEVEPPPRPWLQEAKIQSTEPSQARRPYAARIVHDWTRGAFIVGAVPNFDTEMLDRMLRAYQLIPAWHYHLRDIEAMAIGWLSAHFDNDRIRPEAFSNLGLQDDWKSDQLSRACGVEPPSDEDRHTAMGDALWVERWWDKIMGVR